MDWIREHPYLSGGLVLAIIVLFVVLRRGGSSSQQSAGGPSEALQAAGLQAGVQGSAISAQFAQAQLQANSADAATAAAQTVALAKVGAALQGSEYTAAAALQAQQAGYAASVQSTALTTQAGVAVAGVQANRDITLGGYGVDIARIQAGRDVTLGADQLQLGLAQTGAAVDIAGIQGDVIKAQTAAALEATKNTNATAAQINQQNVSGGVDIAGINAGVATHAIDVSGAVEQNRTNQQGQVIADSFSLAQQHESDVYGPGGLFVGVNRYGGNLQQNQATIEAAIIGQPQVGVSIQQAGASEAQSSASMWAGIVSSLVGGAAKVATAGVA